MQLAGKPTNVFLRGIDAATALQNRTDIMTPRVVPPKTGETLMLALGVDDGTAVSRFT